MTRYYTEDEIVHLSSEKFQSWIEDYFTRKYTAKGFRGVSVGCPCPHGPDVLRNIEQEELVATVFHEGGQFSITMLMEPYHKAYTRDTFRNVLQNNV